MNPIQLPNGAWVIDSDTHYRQWCAGPNGLIHEPWIIDRIAELGRPGDLVVDVGANIGTVSRGLLDRGFAVVGFEPNPVAALCYERNCHQPAHMVALGSRAADSFLWVGSNVGAAYIALDGSVGPETFKVHMRDLDSYRLAPQIIKLDCEGSEPAVLLGAEQTLRCHRPSLFVEVNDQALRQQGSDSEALLWLIGELGYSWEIAQHDCNKRSPMFDVACRPVA